MAKPVAKKYFPGCIAAIYYRKEKKHDVQMRNHFPYFDTWLEAHGYMLNRARSSVARLERDLASAKRHLANVEAMKEPEGRECRGEK